MTSLFGQGGDGNQVGVDYTNSPWSAKNHELSEFESKAYNLPQYNDMIRGFQDQQMRAQSREAPQGVGADVGKMERVQGADLGKAAQAQYSVMNPAMQGQASQGNAAQMNFAQAMQQQINQGQSNQERAAQLGLQGQLQAAAAGQGPSVANLQLQQATQQNLKAQMAAAASMRGGVNPALAQRNLGLQGAATGQQAAAQSAMIKMQEQQAAQANLGNLLSGVRGQDINMAQTQAQLNQQAALQNAAQRQAAFGQNAGFLQQANMQNAQLGQNMTLANMDAWNQRNAMQAQLNQGVNLANMQGLNQYGIAQGQLNQQAMLSNQDWQNKAQFQNAQNQQQMAMQNMQNQLQMAGLNDAQIQAMMKMQFGVNAAQMGASQALDQSMKNDALQWEQVKMAAQNHAMQNQNAAIGSIFQGAASMAGAAAMSDEKTKNKMGSGTEDVDQFLTAIQNHKNWTVQQDADGSTWEMDPGRGGGALPVKYSSPQVMAKEKQGITDMENDFKSQLETGSEPSLLMPKGRGASYQPVDNSLLQHRGPSLTEMLKEPGQENVLDTRGPKYVPPSAPSMSAPDYWKKEFGQPGPDLMQQGRDQAVNQAAVDAADDERKQAFLNYNIKGMQQAGNRMIAASDERVKNEAYKKGVADASITGADDAKVLDLALNLPTRLGEKGGEMAQNLLRKRDMMIAQRKADEAIQREVRDVHNQYNSLRAVGESQQGQTNVPHPVPQNVLSWAPSSSAPPVGDIHAVKNDKGQIVGVRNQADIQQAGMNALGIMGKVPNQRGMDIVPKGKKFQLKTTDGQLLGEFDNRDDALHQMVKMEYSGAQVGSQNTATAYLSDKAPGMQSENIKVNAPADYVPPAPQPLPQAPTENVDMDALHRAALARSEQGNALSANFPTLDSVPSVPDYYSPGGAAGFAMSDEKNKDSKPGGAAATQAFLERVGQYSPNSNAWMNKSSEQPAQSINYNQPQSLWSPRDWSNKSEQKQGDTQISPKADERSSTAPAPTSLAAPAPAMPAPQAIPQSFRPPVSPTDYGINSSGLPITQVNAAPVLPTSPVGAPALASSNPLFGAAMNNLNPQLANPAIGTQAYPLQQALAMSDKKNKNVDDDKVQEFLDVLRAHKYTYKDPSMPGAGAGTYVSPMAQELEQSALGKNMVMDTPNGKMVDYGHGFGTILAAQAVLNERLKKLETKKGKA